MKKTILISGGSEGLGFTIAKRLSKNNNVIILARSENKLKKASEELNCKYKVCDVSDWKEVENTVNDVIKEEGGIDVVVNNAGLWIQGPLEENDPKVMNDVLKVNALGVMYLSKAVIPHMKEKKSGWIININSQAGFYAKAERTVYGATKWAITGFTKSLFQELKPYGIKVVGIYPPFMDTGMFEKVGIQKDRSKAIDTDEIAKMIEFIFTLDEDTVTPEIGLMGMNY